MSKYKIKVNTENEFVLTEKDIEGLDSVLQNDGSYHILKDNKSYHAKFIKDDFDNRSYIIRINGNDYNVKIGTELDMLIKELGFELGKSKQVNSINAPMPGLILSINAKEGQEVAEGDSLLILEAMKMENILNSPRAGVIKSINVKEGDAVDKNQLLIEFE